MIWLFGVLFFLILIAIIAINAKVNGGFKIESAWIAAALAPAIIWLLASGQLSEFGGFGISFKLREAIAAPVSLKLQGSKVDPIIIQSGGKGAADEIPEFIQNKVPALSFKLGQSGYVESISVEYLEKLTRYDFFHYVVFITLQKKFRGLVRAHKLLDQIRSGDIQLVPVITEGTIDQIDGIVTTFISEDATKREALRKMSDLDLTELPVVNKDGMFIGVVDRGKLTSSVVLELIANL